MLSAHRAQKLPAPLLSTSRMDAERRLSDAEVTAVLRRATDDSAQQGLTAAQVQEIARDVGLAPDAVRRALADAASGALRPAELERSLGVPVGANKDVMLPGVLSDASWDVLVSTMRATFNAHGKEIRTGVVREWRNGNLRVAVEPTPAGHRLRMSTHKQGALRAPLVGSAAMLMYGGSLAAAATTTGKPALMMLAAIPAVLGAGLATWPFLSLPKWARARSEQFDLIAREAAALCIVAHEPGTRAARLPTGA